MTHGGVTPLELAVGQASRACPTGHSYITTPKVEEELTVGQIWLLAPQSYQEAQQSADVRRDLAQHPAPQLKPKRNWR